MRSFRNADLETTGRLLASLDWWEFTFLITGAFEITSMRAADSVSQSSTERPGSSLSSSCTSTKNIVESTTLHKPCSNASIGALTSASHVSEPEIASVLTSML